MKPIQFQPIVLPRDEPFCVEFRADSYAISFGDAKRFYEIDGQGSDRYLKYLNRKIEQDPKSAVHVWQGGRLIGQVELGRFHPDNSIGYVNLYYLISEMRGQGFGELLDQYAMSYFRELGLSMARLSVSPENTAALWFYQKMQWRDLGIAEHDPTVRLMEKIVS